MLRELSCCRVSGFSRLMCRAIKPLTLTSSASLAAAAGLGAWPGASSSITLDTSATKRFQKVMTLSGVMDLILLTHAGLMMPAGVGGWVGRVAGERAVRCPSPDMGKLCLGQFCPVGHG